MLGGFENILLFIIDISLVGLLAYLCVQVLLLKAQKNNAQTSSIVSDELSSLENSLRGLLQEAKNSSLQLDKTLVSRKNELVDLLDQLQTKETNIKAKVQEQEELPNDSWSKPSKFKAYKEIREAAKTNTEHAQEIEQLLKEKKDPVTLSSNSLLQKQQLANEIEIVREQKPVLQIKKSKSTMQTIKDPTALKIATRLLQEGKEIHVVARKLEIPLADVRALDLQLRGEESGQEQIHEIVLQEEYRDSKGVR